MDDFGNIIYIVVGIAWFFYNAYRKSQGEKQAPDAKPRKSARSRRKSTSSEPQTLEELIFGKQDPEPIQAKHTKVEVSQVKNQDKFLNFDRDHSHLPEGYKMSVSESGSHRIQRQVQPLVQKEYQSEANVMDELFPEGFDLKKAVVLNAILERPYA
jgi:hypothetical protein